MRTAPLLLLFVLLPEPALALPRFAARNSLRCLQCHVNPTGGGIRNRYGADVFALTRLPLGEATWSEEEDAIRIPFSGAVTEWLSVGADLRLAFLLGSFADRVTTSLFLMQGDLYHAAELGEHVTLVLDIGVNRGFEAWALLRIWPRFEPVDVSIKVGRFLPAFGLREVNHSLFTRERIGIGNAVQDTGIEVTADSTYAALTLALVNGTLGEPFDEIAPGGRRFDKGVLARASVRVPSRDVGFELGGSVYYNQNTVTPNPVFRLQPGAGVGGVDELRAGGFLLFGLGRFALLGDGVFIRDTFVDGSPDRMAAAAYGELSMNVIQGLDLIAGFEFLDRDLEAHQDGDYRISGAIELFPWAFTELRVMVRHELGPALPEPITDLVAFLHVFL